MNNSTKERLRATITINGEVTGEHGRRAIGETWIGVKRMAVFGVIETVEGCDCLVGHVEGLDDDTMTLAILRHIQSAVGAKTFGELIHALALEKLRGTLREKQLTTAQEGGARNAD